MRIRHDDMGGTIIQQNFVRQRVGWNWGADDGAWSAAEPMVLRDRVAKAAFGVFGGDEDDLKWHKPLRPDSELTPDQLWQIYTMCGDLRAAVDSIARRVSTQDRRVLPSVDASSTDYERALSQASAIWDALEKPNEEDDWRTFAEKLVRDALVFWHGVMEATFETVVITQPGEPMELRRGPLEEFVPVYGPTIHPIQDEFGRLMGYLQDPGSQGFKSADGWTFLQKDQVIRLVLQPNTRSPYQKPIIETIVREVTTVVRASERAMYTMDRSEIAPGYLVLTGMTPKAADDFRESSRATAGKDHKLKIIHSAGATAPAQWIRVQQTIKEIDMLPVTGEAKKIIWRNYGVTPVEMGEVKDSNRASSSAELEVGDSHLVEPLLEAIATMVNRRMAPLIVQRHEQDPEAELLAYFEFVREEGETASEENDRANAAKTRLQSGQTTINEERTAMGRPRVEGGDVVRVDGLPIGATGDDDDDDDNDDNDDNGGGGQEGGEVLDEDVEADEEANRCGPSCGHRPDQPHDVAVLLTAGRAEVLESRRLARRASDDLPSDWQPAGRFRGRRVLKLTQLHDQVVAYRQRVEPMWREAEREVLAATGAAWRANRIGTSDHLHRVGQALEALRTNWSVATRSAYLATAEIGAVGARTATGSKSVAANHEAQALAYHDQAMAWLDGLISDVKARVVANVSAVRSAYAVRAPQKADPGLSPDSELDDLLEAVEHSFGANEHRIDNWSGRLVELANLAMIAGMVEHSGESDDVTPGEAVILGDTETAPVEEQAPTEWWVSWEYVGDERMCVTCEREGSAPIRKARDLPTTPGGATECRARCRCVLVWWTGEEVRDGTARKVNR